MAAVLPWSLFGNKQIYAFEPDSKGQGLWIGFLQGGIAYCIKGKVTRQYEASDGRLLTGQDDLRSSSSLTRLVRCGLPPKAD